MNLTGLNEEQAALANETIIKVVCAAFCGGVSTALHLHTRNIFPKEQVEIVQHYLSNAGLDTDEGAAAILLAKSLATVVRMEESEE